MSGSEINNVLKKIVTHLSKKEAFICDMDGVLYHGNRLLPGAKEFANWLKSKDKRFLFLTNSSERSPRELQQKLARLDVTVEQEHFYTSALATASFLGSQNSHGTAFVIGEAGLINALYEIGITMNDVNPDYVVVGETRTYSYERIEKAVHLVQQGAKLIGTNPDLTGPTEAGIVPACGALIAPIELATNRPGSRCIRPSAPPPPGAPYRRWETDHTCGTDVQLPVTYRYRAYWSVHGSASTLRFHSRSIYRSAGRHPCLDK